MLTAAPSPAQTPGEKPSSSPGLALAPSWQRQPMPMGAGVMLRRMVVPGVHGGIQQSMLWALTWADKLLQTLYEHLYMLWALAQHGWHGPFQALQPCVLLSCRACLGLPVPDMRRHWTLSTDMLQDSFVVAALKAFVECSHTGCGGCFGSSVPCSLCTVQPH